MVNLIKHESLGLLHVKATLLIPQLHGPAPGHWTRALGWGGGALEYTVLYKYKYNVLHIFMLFDK
jgi:hypothetical protein